MFPHIGFTQFLWTTKLFFCLEPQFPLFRVYIWKQISCTFVAFLWTVVLVSAVQLFIQKTVQGTCLCLEALVYFHLCWAKIFSLACLAAVVLAFLQFSAGFLSHHFLGCLDSSATRYTCSVIYTCALPWGTYWCSTTSPLSRWFLEPLFWGPITLWAIFISYCRTFRWANHSAWLDVSLSIHWQNVRTYPIMVNGYAAIVTLFWYCLCRTFPLLCLPWHGFPQSHIVQPCLAMASNSVQQWC